MNVIKSNRAASNRSDGLDPVTLEVIRNSLPAISDEMSVDLQRTSYNMMIYEVRDYCTALLDLDGALISQNVGGVSHFVADLGVIIKDAVDRFGLASFSPGDVIIHNHQRSAGQHLNNVVIYTPAFFEDELVAFAIVRAHWVDVGGLSTGFGSAAGAHDPWAEGLQFDQIKLYEKGVPDAKMLKMIRDNIRYPDASLGDLRSQMAACKLGERRFNELLRRYGKDVARRAIKTLYAETEAKARAAVEKIPDGVYEAESHFDTKGGGYVLKAVVTVAGSDMTIDLSGCSPQSEEGPNCRSHAAAYIAYKALTGPMEPLNEGAFGGLKVIIPEGNFLMARYPAIMSSWSTALPSVVDTIWKAFAQALPELIPGAHSGTLGGSLSYSGYDPIRKKPFVSMSIEAGGWGGRPYEDGEDAAMSVCQGDVRNAPIENLELKLPMMVMERSLRTDSGGAGRYRGGCGVAFRLRALASGRLNASPGGRQTCPPWGTAGGGPGAIQQTLVKEEGEAEFHKPAAPLYFPKIGSEVVYLCGGGGGWGDALDREPERVLRDVIEGYVSAEAADKLYGVVLTGDGATIDAAATAARRDQMRAAQGAA